MFGQALLVLLVKRGIKRGVQALGNAAGADPQKTQQVARTLSLGGAVLLAAAVLDPIGIAASIGEETLTGGLS